MTIQAIHYYHNAVHKIYQFSGQTHEQAIKDEFKRLLNHYCDARNLLVVSEIDIKNKRGELIRPDGMVKNNLRLDCGYWESKALVIDLFMRFCRVSVETVKIVEGMKNDATQ